jgi:hypothetical protein
MDDQTQYRGPIRSIDVDTFLGSRPTGRIIANGRRVGYWWRCGCEVRGSEPFAVLRGCNQHEPAYAHVALRDVPEGFTGGERVEGLE